MHQNRYGIGIIPTPPFASLPFPPWHPAAVCSNRSVPMADFLSAPPEHHCCGSALVAGHRSFFLQRSASGMCSARSLRSRVSFISYGPLVGTSGGCVQSCTHGPDYCGVAQSTGLGRDCFSQKRALSLKKPRILDV